MDHAIVRPARTTDLVWLAPIERAAASRFAQGDIPSILRTNTLDAIELRSALEHALLWVAELDETVVGFLAATQEDAHLHVLEVSLLPAFGRQGLGSSLLDAVVLEARNRGLDGVTLTTFAHVAWNGPAYARRGFSQVVHGQLSPALKARLDSDARHGLVNRIAMRRSVA